MDRFAALLVCLAVTRTRWVFACFALLSLLAAPLATRITIDPGFDSMMLAGDPDRERNLAMKGEFSNDEAIVLALDLGRPFGATDLRVLNDLSEQISALPGVEEVLDLSTIEDVRGDRDWIDASPLVDFDALPGDLPRIRERVRGHRLYERNLVSADGRVLALIAIPEFRRDDPSLAIELVASTLPIVEAARETCRCDIHLSGYATSIWDANRIMQRDLAALGGLALAIVLALTYAAYRRLSAVALALAVIVWAQLATAAFFGASGRPITIATGLVTPMVTALSSTYAIYVLGLLRSCSDDDRPAATLVTLVARPAVISSLSTAAGFLSLNLMPVQGVRDLGNALCVAVAASASAAMLLAPALVHRFSVRLPTRRGVSLERFSGLGVALARRPGRTVGIAALAVAAAAGGIPRLEVESNPLAFWDPQSAFRVGDEFVRRHLGGIHTINVVIRSREERGALEPVVLEYADRVVERLEASPAVDRSVSFLDYLYLMDAALRPDATPRTVPASREQAAQYLLLYESGGDPGDLRHYINFKRSAVNVFGKLVEWNSSRVLELQRELVEFSRAEEPAGVSTEVIGTRVLTDRAHEIVASAVVRGLLVATSVIFLMLVLSFPIVWTINYLGNPDNGVIFTGVVATFLVAMCYLAVTSVLSVLTRSQLVAFLFSFAICMVVYLAGFPPLSNLLMNLKGGALIFWPFLKLLNSIGVMPHFTELAKGVLGFRDVIFFVTFVAFCLFATAVALRTRRA